MRNHPKPNLKSYKIVGEISNSAEHDNEGDQNPKRSIANIKMFTSLTCLRSDQ